jgi:hypothetical protein
MCLVIVECALPDIYFDVWFWIPPRTAFFPHAFFALAHCVQLLLQRAFLIDAGGASGSFVDIRDAHTRISWIFCRQYSQMGFLSKVVILLWLPQNKQQSNGLYFCKIT